MNTLQSLLVSSLLSGIISCLIYGVLKFALKRKINRLDQIRAASIDALEGFKISRHALNDADRLELLSNAMNYVATTNSRKSGSRYLSKVRDIVGDDEIITQSQKVLLERFANETSEADKDVCNVMQAFKN
ncbi:MAG: hypothetical protein QM796_18440 [Chthoniobacteraceae bacterium]